ncbi:MAG: hypothetical protein V4617_21355 [Gemmatimonadota bacterium]
MTSLRTISLDESTGRARRGLVMRSLLLAGASLLSASIVAEQAAAQDSNDPRWTPYLGCWAPPVDNNNATIGLSRSGSGGGRDAVCVIPTASPNVVQVTSIVNGRKVAGETVDASGTRVAKTVDGCTGWESASWSEDGHRLLLRSEYKCANDLLRKSSGVFAISNDGSWVDVQGIDVNGASGVRVIRLRDIGVEGATLRTIASAAIGDTVGLGTSVRAAMSSQTIRLAAASPIDARDIFEVTRSIDLPVAKAWLAGLDQQFEVDANRLVRLADAGLPPDMIDLIVAKAYPKNFAIDAAGADAERLQRERRGGANSLATIDPFALSRLNCFQGMGLDYGMMLNDPCLGMSVFGRSALYGYGSNLMYMRNGFGNRYGYNPYGGYNPYFGGPPIIVVNPGNGNTPAGTQGARAVRGSGYTRDSGPQSRPASTPRVSEPSSGGGASGSSSPASSGGGGGATEVRTAKPKGGGQ